LFLIELDRLEDSRGSFARSFCVEEFEAHGMEGRIAQCNVSYNARKGTLRGLHFQAPPHEEAKLVSCAHGAIFDVVVDIRRESPTYLKWSSCQLAARDGRMLYIPKGFAHGFQTLDDQTEVNYAMFEFYRPESARGLRWNDPALSIPWPIQTPIMSEKDQQYPLIEWSD
jgi:dTDP-4-dehydrorhamnose 3,5-epimerase